MSQADSISGEPQIGAQDPRALRRHIVLVTGLAGAGRSTALKCLEDIGYEAVDNMPLDLLPHLVTGLAQASLPAMSKPVALGIDSRTTGFSSDGFIELVRQLKTDKRFRVSLVFLDCEDEVLRRRYTETRRRHPLAQDRPVGDGILRERQLMRPLRAEADLVLDTSDTAIGDLKAMLTGHFGLAAQPDLAITIVSFSYKQGLPREADLVFDVRFLENPYYDPALRPLSGQDAAVGRAIEADPAFPGFFAALTSLLWPLLPGYEGEGKSYLTIAIGCTGGRHRSVFVAGKLAEWLKERGRSVTLRHRDVGRAAG
ncbi:RNase adapter RapZ [Dongia sp.]|uniref:RNase adapter RapZ n=1 Tax=Dongia sp. TaxID=1977262 RepID=UPI0035ADF79D